ncbi:ArsA family ATPase [Streptomyces avicenniae]|uniref:ArsA family ATPase n=1 Tax=Streptomyces avicenniae TaxID=500153 RepID=UPI00069A5E68|nr:ArsA-related P-loop ATPase [Streptomyces avicenniae]
MTPAPRVLFVTGPGGDGTSTVAAATAHAASRAGTATLLLSAEPPARLAALLGAPPPVWPAVRRAATGPSAARIDPAADFRAAVLAGQRHARPFLDALGADALDDDELTELPGARDLALLHAVRTAHDAGDHALVVVDLPPYADALRLLALPEQLRRYLRRLLPPERQSARALRPFLAQLVGLPMPADGLYGTAARWDEALGALERVVTGPRAAVRLVIDPGPRSATALDAARAGLALHGLALDAVVANRLLPADSPDPRWTARAARQRAVLAALDLPVPLAELPLLDGEPGPDDLTGAAVPPPYDEAVRPAPVLEDRLAAEGLLIWRLPLPGAAREEVGLVRRGDELLVTTGPFRRALPLPSALRRCTVAGAALTAPGELAVRFAPDPARWPAPRGAGEREG